MLSLFRRTFFCYNNSKYISVRQEALYGQQLQHGNNRTIYHAKRGDRQQPCTVQNFFRRQTEDRETDANGDVQKFPSFEGKDLDGNEVKSDELFSANAVTVVNFWFTTCSPCVGELGDLDALNKELAEKGGALIGVNTFTLDGDEAAISEAKDVLAKKGAAYQNVYFDSDGEAGKFTANIFAYPTTYVIDRNGNIVGEPIVGAITEQKQAETLQKLINQALAADMG